MEQTGREVACGAPTVSAVKGQAKVKPCHGLSSSGGVAFFLACENFWEIFDS